MKTEVPELVVLLLAALATGGLMVNWIGLGRAMSQLSVSAYVEFHQLTNRTFDPYMPIVVIGAPAGGAVLAAMYGVHSTPGQLAAGGAACYALVITSAYPHVCASTIILVHSEPAARMGPGARAMDPVSHHSNVVPRSRLYNVSSCRDFHYRPSIIVMSGSQPGRPGATPVPA